jgi:hypothetical protein
MAAITPQFPLPLPPWAKWGLRALPFVWAAGRALLDHPGTVPSSGDLIWRRAVVHWARGTGVGAEDDAVITIDMANITNSAIDGTWDSADYNTVGSHLNVLLEQIALQQNAFYKAYKVDYYRMQFADPMTPARRFVPSGPPESSLTVNWPGLSVNDALPPQVAMSVTERTSIPRHWGRVYIPGLTESATAVGGTGRWVTGLVDGMGNAFTNFYNSMALANFPCVVVSTQADGVLGGSLLGITHVQVDDLPDVIRRRRPDRAAHKFVSA